MIIPSIANSFLPVNITKREEKFIDMAFKQELKEQRQKNTVRRNDDNAYSAALTCLAKDMVTATPEEAELIAAKMNFIQNLVNQNLKTDANLSTQKNDDSRAMMESESVAYARKTPHKTELIKTTIDGFTNAADTLGKTAINCIKI